MKKLLLVITVALAITANAQTTKSPSVAKVAPLSSIKATSEVNQSTTTTMPTKPTRRSRPSTDKVNCVSVIPIGHAGNSFGSLRNNTQTWYDANINTVSFVHRSQDQDQGVHGIGAIMYDYSTDGGATWPTATQVNQGPIFFDPTATNATDGTIRARYPNGLIYNPDGNTVVSGAYMTAFGAITDNTNWQSVYTGTRPIGGTTNQEATYICDSNAHQLIPDGFQVIKNTGVVWGSCEEIDVCASGTNNNDTIILSKGIYNTATHGFDYTFTQVPLGLTIDLTSGLYNYSGHQMAWSDDGMIGYLAVKGNDGTPYLPDTSTYLIIYKTTDGGATWNHLSSTPNIELLNSLLTANPSGTLYISDFQVDCVVDKNNNLHCIVTAYPDAGAGNITIAPMGTWGVFHIYTTDGGTTWYGKLLFTPYNFNGQFGSGTSLIEQRSEVQATRSWDGSKVFLSWIDTDSAKFMVSATNNLYPDWYAVGYDVVDDKWTNVFDYTNGCDGDGEVQLPSVSYYSVNHGSTECIPMVYLKFSATPIDPVTFYYVDAACVTDADYTISTGQVLLAPVGINELNKAGFAVSSNYPNPFNGSTSFDITLTKPADVTVEVSNMVGQILSTKSYKTLHSGKNQLTIDASGFASGIYTYKVKVGGEVVTRTMSVK